MRSTLRRRTFSRARRLTAIATVVSLITGALALGVAAQMATAAAWAPSVSAVNVDPSGAGKDFVLAGENVSFSIDVANNSGGAQFNLALVASLPANVSYVPGGDLAAPKVYAAGDVLPNRARTAADASCASLGLVNAPGQALRCAVPAGQQVWVWSNVNDLPQGGTVSPTITVAPNEDYPVGSAVGFSIAAYTSNDPTRLPTFDGSPSVSRTTAHTSGAGVATDDVPVQALRIVKDEPSAEDELIRGVHGIVSESITTYTLKVENTTRGATNEVTVTDYLPAGLEYLGLAVDNDNSSGVEYPGAPVIDGGTTVGESVDTVELSASEAAALGLPGAGVYTKIVWTLGPLDSGEKRVIEYHAAVPLFANALWADGAAPDVAAGEQAANLDNNTGASTRHGGDATPESAQTFRNIAMVDGTYQGPVLNDDPALRAAHDDDTEIIEAVDVRVLKRVDTGGLFTTGSVATYSIDLRVSEYVDASDIVLTDVIPNGLCPAFPGSLDGVDLIIGSDKVSQATWNAQAPGDACNYPTTEPAAVLSPELNLTSITYTPADGTFTVVFDVDPLSAGQHFVAQYSVTQRPNYTGAGGGTSSGDSFVNKVSVTAKTEPIAAIANDPTLRDRVGGTRYVFDDSAAVIGSDRTILEKTVLERGTTPDMEQPDELLKQATKPFSPGDDVWYRLFVDFADGIDSRNPLLTDYLPEGIEVQELRYAYTGIPGVDDVMGPVAYGSPGFPTAYIPNVAPTGASLTWELGARNRTTSGDRFMPEGSTLTVFVRGTVKAQSASQDEVDNPLNQAKYQQVNVDGVLDFQRSDAGIDLDWGSTLTKGIVEVNGRAIAGSFGDRDQSEQVVQGDVVDYRIDVKAPQNTTTDYVVWDVLPAGVKKADVSAPLAELHPAGTRLSATDAVATMYDAGESLPDGIALNSAFNGRSVIVWKIGASIAGSVAATETTPETVSGFSLGYTVTVPDGTVDGGGDAAQLTQKYTNTAGIVDYAVENAGGGTTTVVPQRDGGGQQLTTRTPGDGEVAASDIDTVDSAEVYLPDVKVAKTLYSSEIAPVGANAPGAIDTGDGTRNGTRQIVQGEYATFEYSVTIPAKTTIRGAVLSDNGWLALQNDRGGMAYQLLENETRYFKDGTSLAIGASATQFRVSERQGDLRGVLTFPDVYTNTTDIDQVFSARITVWVKDLRTAETLTNTATTTFLDPNSSTGTTATRSATATVDHVVPAPSLTKRAASTAIGASGKVDFTLTASNAPGRPALYDVVIVDCVPKELAASNPRTSTGQANVLDESCSATTAGVITRGTGSGTVVEWKIPMLVGAGTAPTMTYTGTVEAQAGGSSQFVNRATLTGYTLPSTLGDDTDTTDRRGAYTANANATVSMPPAAVRKSVSPTTAAVGDVVTYTVTTSLPANTNFYDVTLTDALPAGVEFVPTGTHTETLQWSGDTRVPTIGAPTLSNGVLSWKVESNDIPAWTDQTERTITVTYQARLTPAVKTDKPVNTASFSWSKINDSVATGDRVTRSATANVTIVDPKVTVAKTVRAAGSAPDAFSNKASGNPDQSFEYRIAVKNTGAVPAYGVVVTDTVPVGISVDTTQEVFAGATIDDRERLLAGKGGSITWTIPGPLSNVDGSNTHEITYYGAFAASTDMSKDAVLKNSVAVNEYTSKPNNGWTYVPGDKNRPAGKTPGGVTLTPQAAEADIAPHFPQVVLGKKATNDGPAFIGESFSWTLQATNTGEGAAQTVTLTDTLPENWAYDPTVTPVLTVGEQPVIELGDPTLGQAGDRQTVTWKLEHQNGDALLPGTIDGATEAQRTLTVEFSSKPEFGATNTAGAGLEFAHTNTVSGAATDTSTAEGNVDGPYVGDPATADAHIARADLKIVKEAIGGDADGAWTAGEILRAGYTQPQWRITVTNQGPDAANGPFRIVDEADLPDGVTMGQFSAEYFTDADDTDGEPMAVAGTGTEADPFIVGGSTFTLKADGSDRLVLLADVDIDESAVGSASNTASVAGRTYERPEDIAKDNSAQVTQPLASAADLVLIKDVTTTEVTAGRPITWSISVRNDGPSAASTTSVEPERRAAATPITVTDTVPAGIGEVQDPSAGLTDWTVAASDGWPASAGDVITWTYTGSQMPVGAAQQLFLTGTVDASWTDGEIANSAVVDSPVTVDPTPENNEDTVTVTPGDQTSLAITKTRVVLDDGEWKDAAQFGGSLPEVAAGSTASYRVVVTNNGPADARAVTVTDQAPEMLTYVEVTDERGEWTHVAPEPEAEADAELVGDDLFSLAGTLPAAAGDDSRSFIVTYALPAELEPGTEVSNVVVARAENSTNTPDDLDSTASDRLADLSIVKQAIDADGAPVADGVVPQVTAGTQTRFLLTVTNEGPSFSSAPIEIVDQLPAGLTYVSSTVDVAGAGALAAEPAVGDDGREIAWSVLGEGDVLAVGATIVIEVTTDVAPDVRAQRLVNAADVAGPDDADAGNNHAEAIIDVVTLAEFTITKTVADGPWISGTEVAYTITVHNDGPSFADALVTDVLPAGLTPVSIEGEGRTCETAQSCIREAHPLGDSVLTVIARVDANVPTGTALTNTATVEWTDSRATEPRQVSDDAVIDVTTNADLSLVKTAIDAEGQETASAVAGESARYRVEVSNFGTSDAIGPITVVDQLPSGTRFAALVGESAAAWTARADDADPQSVTFTLAPASTGLAAGGVAPAIEFDVLVDASVANGAVLTNSATVASGTPDANPENDSDTADVTVAREVDLSITKSHVADAVRIGDLLPFAITARNAGPSEATEVVVTDTVPAGLEVVTAAGNTADGWTIETVAPVDGADAAAGTLVVARYSGALAAGERTSILVVETRVLAAAYPEVVNVADVTSAEITDEHPDRTPGDNRAEDAVTVPPMATLVVTKSAVGAFQVGGEGEFEITVRNDGPTADPAAITVTDALPEGLRFVSSPDEGVRVDGQVVTWTLANGLAVGEEVTLTVRVSV
ncbi:isopeptide-forming domain-containing fimbrial protein, partial [Microbacterium sp.]|uniref:isopeptide-forming domain-containing fimbrial protein n=1 Tax=Microbacterium sp. TaxID=51671 RepID=UPI00289977DE